MYIETSSPRLVNHKARLESEEFQPTGASGRCLKFWYHMYGPTIGTLNVWMSSNGTTGQIWSLSRDRGNKWLFGQAPVSSKGVYQVCTCVILSYFQLRVLCVSIVLQNRVGIPPLVDMLQTKYSFNPLSPKSDLNLISPHNITY